MNSTNTTFNIDRVVEINWAARWQVYQRLQQLEIPCQCQTDRPLTVQINSPVAAIQLWSVVQQFTAPRWYLLHWLNECFSIKANN